jgi:hypothetical protein
LTYGEPGAGTPQSAGQSAYRQRRIKPLAGISPTCVFAPVEIWIRRNLRAAVPA